MILMSYMHLMLYDKLMYKNHTEYGITFVPVPTPADCFGDGLLDGELKNKESSFKLEWLVLELPENSLITNLDKIFSSLKPCDLTIHTYLWTTTQTQGQQKKL